jgi:Mrp family chromosome partitioning ATPase
MTSGGAEALKAAIRRSLPIIIGFVLLGIVAVNVVKQLQGPRYEATAKVLISTTPLSKIITGTEPGFVDPQRIQDTAQTLAGSPQVYQLAASQGGSKLGGAGTMKAATTVGADPNSDILSFTSASSDPKRAAQTVNAVAAAYVAYRANLSGASISNTVNQIRGTLAGLPPGSAQRADLEKQLNKLSVLQSLNSSDAAVVQRASGANKTTPSPVKDSLLGFSIGLVVALLFVALREAIDTTVRRESDVEDLLSAPVLASVRPLPRRMRMVTYGRHEAAFADSYALLAAQLVQNTTGKDGVVLAVTSSLAGEGKTTTASNLAVVLARRGARVLLADFDFRNPALAEVFDLPEKSAGALQVAAGSARLEEALWSVSLDGPRPRVSLNGKLAANGAEPELELNGDASAGSLHLLSAGGMVRSQTVTHASRLVPLLGELRSRADFVILDTPPALLTVEMSELARAIDLVLVVVRQGFVSQRSLRSLGRQARTWDAELAGAVMTDAPVEAGTANYYGGR